MIKSKDRSGRFGASDAQMICGNRNTETFKRWWLEKLGATRRDFASRAMNAGTWTEHRILDKAAPGCRKDRQKNIRRLLLRVNLDGDRDGTIYEVKTHGAGKPYKPTRAHVMQVNVQMFATGMRKAFIVSYAREEEDELNFFREIDPARMKLCEVTYDADFIESEFLPNLRELAGYLKRGEMPV